jgi:hypothetical protein
MTHTVTIEGVKEDLSHIIRHDLASSFGKGSNKRLVVCLDIGNMAAWFDVYNNREVVGTFNDVDEAVEFYNGLP